MASLAERSIRYEVEAERAAGDGDRLTIDFSGRVGEEEFEGGKGEDVQLVVGQSRFIPGFVEGLAGAKAGEERAVNAKFPDDYPEPKLAGKDAVFAVKVKEVAKPIKPEMNDEFAKTLGAESFAKLRELVAGQDRQRVPVDHAHEAEAPDPGRARQGARLRAARDAGRRPSSTASGSR